MTATVDAEDAITAWNTTNPVGTWVNYLRGSATRRTRTRTQAWMLANRIPSVRVDGVTAPIPLRQVERAADQTPPPCGVPFSMAPDLSRRALLDAVTAAIGAWTADPGPDTASRVHDALTLALPAFPHRPETRHP